MTEPDTFLYFFIQRNNKFVKIDRIKKASAYQKGLGLGSNFSKGLNRICL